MTVDKASITQDFIDARGYWPEMWDGGLMLFNAPKLGATPAEIMEVPVLTSVPGGHTMAVGVLALLAE